MTPSRLTPPPRWTVLLTAAASLLAHPAAAQTDAVTDTGFDEQLAGATLYAEVPMVGVLGVDAPAQSVNQTLRAAADNPHVQHAVFMVDSIAGEILDREVVGRFDGDLEITAVVRTAMRTAAFPVFFADNIYLVDEGLLGGLPLHLYVAEGSEEVTAKQVGIFSSMAASAAEAHGHHPDIVRAMINEKEDLYFWREGDEPVLSNTRPDNAESLEDFRKVRPALPGSTLTVDQAMAVEFGLAGAIDDFDAMIVGEYLGQDNWLPANNFGRVANEIGSIVAELEPLRESIAVYEKELPDIRNRDNVPRDILNEYREYKRSLESSVEALDKISQSLEELYKVHPERHTYFPGAGGQTIVEDADRWARDMQEARKWYGQANGAMREMENGYKRIGGDSEELYDLIQRMRVVGEHLNGISRYGNADYWANHAEPDLPDDLYGPYQP